MAQSLREKKLAELPHIDRTLHLAGTMALKTMKRTPLEVIRARKGFVTSFKIPGVYDIKTEAAKIQKTQIDPQTGQLKPISDDYITPSDHRFRDLEIPKSQKDFVGRYKCPPPYNPYGISDHDRRPKEVLDKQRETEEKEKMQK